MRDLCSAGGSHVDLINLLYISYIFLRAEREKNLSLSCESRCKSSDWITMLLEEKKSFFFSLYFSLIDYHCFGI